MTPVCVTVCSQSGLSPHQVEQAVLAAQDMLLAIDRPSDAGDQEAPVERVAFSRNTVVVDIVGAPLALSLVRDANTWPDAMHTHRHTHTRARGSSLCMCECVRVCVCVCVCVCARHRLTSQASFTPLSTVPVCPPATTPHSSSHSHASTL